MNPRQKSALTRIFAISGTVILWAPILFMLLTAIVGSIASGTLLMDYLLLIEVFPLVALGLVLLVMATLLTHTFRKLIGWGSVAALILLSGGQILAVASGIASGAAPASGVNFVILNISIILFNILILALAILAIFLLKRIFAKKLEPTPEA